MIQRKEKEICIIAYEDNAYSQTFIRDHIKSLDAYPIFIKNLTICNTDYSNGISLSFKKALNSLKPLLKVCFPSKIEKSLIKRELIKIDPSIVLVEFADIAVRALDACRELDIPMVTHFHGYDVYNTQTVKKIKNKLPALFEYSHAVIAVSNHMKNRLVSLGCPPEKIIVNSCGVNTTLFIAKKIFTDDVVYLAVGRFVEKKAPQITINAFAQSLKKYPHAQLLFIGEGHLLKESKKLAKDLGVSDKIHFLGKQSQEQVAQCMQKARVFLQHSVVARNGDSEGMPVAIMEAMASGLPVVTSRHSGIPELVIDKKTGFIVDEGDVQSMASAMVRLAQDKYLAQKMGIVGRGVAEQHFSLKKSIDCLQKTLIENDASK